MEADLNQDMKRIRSLSGPASQLLLLNFCGTFGTTGKLVENLDGAIPDEYDFIRLGRIQTNNGTCMHAKSLQLCLILCDPMDSNSQAPLFMAFFRQ